MAVWAHTYTSSTAAAQYSTTQLKLVGTLIIRLGHSRYSESAINAIFSSALSYITICHSSAMSSSSLASYAHDVMQAPLFASFFSTLWVLGEVWPGSTYVLNSSQILRNQLRAVCFYCQTHPKDNICLKLLVRITSHVCRCRPERSTPGGLRYVPFLFPRISI